MRHRIDITPETKSLLKEVAEKLGEPNLKLSAITELCIQSAHKNIMFNSTEIFLDDCERFMSTLDGITCMLNDILSEV